MPDLTALVPLDGTKLSESALSLLPFLQSLGCRRACLVSVWESDWAEPRATPGGGTGEMKEAAERGRAYLEAYLKLRTDALKSSGMEVETVVRVGRAAEEVLHVARDVKADLVLIATHGRSGVSRWRLGSVADKIINAATCPTLVIGPNVEIKLAPYELKRIMVPLDGSEIAEEALPVARWIAETSGAGIDIVRVVAPPAMAVDPMVGVYPVDLIKAMEEGATLYLDRVAKDIGTSKPVRTQLLSGPVSEELRRYLQANPADLVVMTSHGRQGIVRWALGSVADRLLHGPAPVLVLRPEEDGAASRLTAAARGE